MLSTRGRLTRFAAAAAIGLAWLAFAYVSVVYVGGALAGAAAGALVLVPQAMLWLLSAYQEGMDGWAIAGRVGANLADLLMRPRVTFYLVLLELVGAAALYGLQRLLRDERRGPPEGDQ